MTYLKRLWAAICGKPYEPDCIEWMRKNPSTKGPCANTRTVISNQKAIVYNEDGSVKYEYTWKDRPAHDYDGTLNSNSVHCSSEIDMWSKSDGTGKE